MGTDESDPATLGERIPGSELKYWLLLSANRVAVTVLVLAVVFVGLLGLLFVEPAAFDRSLERGYPIQTLFQALVTAIVTGVTLVVSINSLVLSQELSPVGELRDEMDESTAFREDVAALVGEPVSPAEPASFLGSMLEAAAEHASEIRTAVPATLDDDARLAIVDFADDVEWEAEMALDRLAGAEFGTFDVVAGSLMFDYSAKLFESKRLEGEYDDAIEEETRARLDDLRELLHQFGPAREHVKTLYFQWELVDLSRAILYASIPALIVSAASILVLGDLLTVSGSTLGLSNQAWITVAAATVALSPFAILLAYILRIATVAKRTLAIGPFVLRERRESENAATDE